jgi:hypothetical protein
MRRVAMLERETTMRRGISSCLEEMASASFEARRQGLILQVTRDVLERLRRDRVLLAEHVESIRMVGVDMAFTVGGEEVGRVVDPALWPFWLDGGRLPRGATMRGWLPEIVSDGLKHISEHGEAGVFVVVQFEGASLGDERVPEGLQWMIVSEAIGEAVGRVEKWVVVPATEIACMDGTYVHVSEITADVLAGKIEALCHLAEAARPGPGEENTKQILAPANDLVTVLAELLPAGTAEGEAFRAELGRIASHQQR